MKYIYPLAALVLLITSCNKKEEKTLDRSTTDWAHYNLEGDVKSVSITSKEVMNGNMDTGDTKYENPTEHDTELLFNEEGMLILEKKKNSSGGPYEQINYNGRNQKTEQVQFINNNPGIKTSYGWDETNKFNTSIIRRNPDNTQIDRKEMKYKKGRLAEQITYNLQDNPVDRITYSYDKEGNLINEDIYSGTENIVVRNVYEYNKDNKKVSEVRYDKDSLVIFSTSFEYDGDNLLMKEVKDGKGKTEYLQKMEYTDNNKVKYKTVTDNFDNSQTTEQFKYDEKGNKILWQVTKNEEPYMEVNYSYDDHNNMTGFSVTNKINDETEKRAYTYKYDEKGNWIEKVIAIDGSPRFIEKREISYFD